MKRLIFYILLFSFFSLNCEARKIISTNSGNWNQPSTWIHNYLPQGGDTIEIEEGHIVNISGTQNVLGNKIILIIRGVLRFNVYAHLNIPGGSSVAFSDQGQLKTSNRHTHNHGHANNETLKIGGRVLWRTYNGNVYGPRTYGSPFVIDSQSLPIELVYFDGNEQDGNVVLEWETASEINNQEYIIFRSANGIDYDTLGTVLGAGNSNELNDYKFTDSNPLPNINYYILEQVDFNHSYHEYPTISVQTSTDVQDLKLYPNPANDHLVVEFHEDLSYQVLIYNLNGQEVITPIKKLFNHVVLNTQELPAGIYTLILEEASNKKESIEFVVEH